MAFKTGVVAKVAVCMIAVLAIMAGCSKNKSSSPQPPQISQFAATPADFNPGDTLTLQYAISGADSAILTPPTQKLANPASGSVKVVPSQATRYVITAYNGQGQDSAIAQVGINLTATNGLYYKGVPDSARLVPTLSYRITNAAGAAMTQPWLHLTRLSGDGVLSADSLQPNLSGVVAPSYTFTDSLGGAVLRAIVPGFDTVDVTLRANTLIPGPHGQGQYVSFDDTYGTVKIWNGAPVSNDVDPNYWVTYANYEGPLGVVVEIDDPNHNEKADDNEDVLGVIVTTVYTGKTRSGIGIGSTYDDVIAAYGQPDTIRYDPTAPPVYVIKYIYKGLVLLGAPSDTSIVQIEATEFVETRPGSKQTAGRISGLAPAGFRAPRFR